MATRRKKKKHFGLVLWLILLILLLAIVASLFLAKLVHFEVGNIIRSAPRNHYDSSAFTTVNGRVTYPGAVSGIDVSEHQQKIDWEAVKNDGITFAIIRLGYRGSSKGGLYTDDRFYENLAGAHAAGLEVGVYFYSQANSEAEAIEEARHVLSVLDGVHLECPVFYDWEEGTPRSERLDGIELSDVSTFSDAFCETISEGGYKAGVYFNQKYGYGLRLYDLQDYDFWLAEFDDAVSFRYEPQYWQYTYQGKVDGIQTNVDLDLRFGGNE